MVQQPIDTHTTTPPRLPTDNYIKDEDMSEYLIHYAPHPVTGQPWPEICTPKKATHPELVEAWEEGNHAQAVRDGGNAAYGGDGVGGAEKGRKRKKLFGGWNYRIPSSLADEVWQMPKSGAVKAVAQGRTRETAIEVDEGDEQGSTRQTAVEVDGGDESVLVGEKLPQPQRRPLNFVFEGSAPLTEEEVAESGRSGRWRMCSVLRTRGIWRRCRV